MYFTLTNNRLAYILADVGFKSAAVDISKAYISSDKSWFLMAESDAGRWTASWLQSRSATCPAVNMIMLDSGENERNCDTNEVTCRLWKT